MKMSRRFPLNALRVFEAVARLMNFTRAAEELGMTQTAVTYQIKLLEEFVGAAVFIRKPRAVQLTEVGERLLPKVSDAFALLSDAISDTRQEIEDTLEIQSPPTFASHWLSRHLADFQLQQPNIAVRLTRNMEPGECDRIPTDVAIHIGATPWEGLVCHPLVRLEYTPMLHPKLAESIGGIHEPADLLKLPWVSDAKDTGTDWFDEIGLDARHIRHVNLHTYGALDLQANAAMAGHGVAMLTPFFFRDELASGRLFQPFDLSIGNGQSYWLVYPQARRNAPKVKAFQAWLTRMLADDIAETPIMAAANR
jgi:LysR family glycine cleavage system transcriptional activator